MLHEMFSVYDTKAQAYLPPFILPNTQMAQRVFGDCINSESHQFHHHPDDYILFHLGAFDDASGKMMPHQPDKVSLGSGIEYINHLDHNPDVYNESEETNGQDESNPEEQPKPRIQ